METIAVVGLGYVGLPVAVSLGRHFRTIGFDIEANKIAELRRGYDRTGEVSSCDLSDTTVRFTDDPSELSAATFFIVAVPTPIDDSRRPDLRAIRSASRTVGRALRPGSVVVYESTVYPGVTEEVCSPILARESGLQPHVDFKLGYSPERINPGDKEHSFETILKIVSGEDEETLERVASVYGSVVRAGLFRATSIKVAEAAKVLENTQRDLNIALMNELAVICDRIGVRTNDVLAAAGTKWNFLPFKPGLVGGHCIGVDPYYLTFKAQELGYHPQVILAGRSLNDGMGVFIAQRLLKMLIPAVEGPVRLARVAVLGLTFKEDVPDLRNSRVPDIVCELESYGLSPLVCDPHASAAEAEHECGVSLAELDAVGEMDAIIYAVAHREYRSLGEAEIARLLKPGGVLIDVKAALDPSKLPADVRYWSL